MSRTKEVDPNSDEMPEYKSPANRLVHSLRNAYQNSRKKIADAKSEKKFYQIKTRDLEKSRESWKARTKSTEKALNTVKEENEALKQKVAYLNSELEKKRV